MGVLYRFTFWFAFLYEQDVKETWNSSWPQFTECFQNTVLIWIPSGWVWVTAPIYLCYLCTATGNSLPMSWKFISKSVILALQVIQCVMEIVNAVYDLQPQGHYIRASLVRPTIEAATLSLVLVLTVLEKRRGFITSGVLFICWTLALITKTIPFYSKIILKEYEENISAFLQFNRYFGLILLQWIISCTAERYPVADDKICPELKASFLSRITFWWMNKMMIKGYKCPITENGLFKLRPWDESKTVVPRFEKKWCEERMSLKSDLKLKHTKPPKRMNVNIQESTEETSLLQEQRKPKESKVAFLARKPSLIKVLFKTFGWELLHANIYKLLYDLLLFVSPVLLQYLMMFTNDKNHEGTFHEMWKGYVLSAALFATAMVQSLSHQQLYHCSNAIELRVRAALISALYKKALRINCKAKNASTVGEIVNLVSVDVEHIEEVVTYVFYLWSIPLQIAISMYFISSLVRMSLVSGVVSLFVLLLLNFVAIYLMQKYETKEMEQKDVRMKIFNEVLNGIKSLKLYAWEMTFREKIEAIRNVELDILWKMNLFDGLSDVIWSIAPFVVTFATFTTYVYSDRSGHFLSANTVFVSISLFNIVNFAMNVTPSVVIKTIKAAVSLRRLQKFLNQDELENNSVFHNNDVDRGDAIVIDNGEFSWDEELGCCLSNINIRIPEGSLVAVVGQVGSGKSSLMSAILGEMVKIKGYVNVKGSTAYVPQQAWIQNETLQDNILFGRSMNNGKYTEIVEACALQPDLEMLPAGDMTEIGEKGINLSGGQKQRVSLARAVYYDSDIYLLDDPLSAVDFHVGKHIFDKVLSRKGILKNKTRLLVTHGIHWLPYVDTIIVLNNGRVSEVGSYDELLEHAGAFANYLQAYFLHCKDEETEEDSELYQVRAEIRQRLTSVTSKKDTGASGFEDNAQSKSIPMNETAKMPMYRCKSRDEEEKSLSDIDDQLIEEESVMTGQVKYDVYKAYAKAIGTPYVVVLFLLLGIYHTSTMMGNIWLSFWTEDKTLNNRTLPPNSSVYEERNYYYTGIYGAWGAGQGLSVTLFIFLMLRRTIKASKNLHDGMLHSVIRSPMPFFDTTPAGRIVNRFSSDIENIDNNLPMAFKNTMDACFAVITTITVISYSTPVFVIFVIPLGILYFCIQRFYITTSRQLKRIESKTNSPIYSHFEETLNGVSVIKAFNEQERFLNELEMRIDNNQQVTFVSYSAARWLGFWLEFGGNCIILAASLLAVLSRDSISASVVGLSISYAIEITENLSWFVEMMSDLETKIVSVERVREYTEIPQEDVLIHKNHRPPPTWPSKGVVKFKNYSTRYRPGLDLVLKGIDVTINSGEKVGIVGRTGAGKSSLTLALFRLIEPVDGSIFIDDEDICHMGLHDCRSRLTILPQDPVLFSGTVRTNIDPLCEHSNDQLWQALEHAQLKAYVESLTTNLDYVCEEAGQNFSVGQKQLLCLARSLLRKTKILVLDEATAAVDMETDDLIQQTIRSEFKECTVLTIAHRLNTIMDYDRIMVLDQGKIQEFDSPDNLLKRTGSIFYQLVKDAGILRQTNSNYIRDQETISNSP